MISLIFAFLLALLVFILSQQNGLTILPSPAPRDPPLGMQHPGEQPDAESVNPFVHWRRRQKALRELETNPVTLAFGVEQSYLFTQLRTADTLWAWRIVGATATALSSVSALGWVRPILTAVGAASPVIGGCFPQTTDGGPR